MLLRSVSHENGKDQNEEQAEAKVEEQRQRVELAHARTNVRVDADHGRRGQRVVDVALPAGLGNLSPKKRLRDRFFGSKSRQVT